MPDLPPLLGTSSANAAWAITATLLAGSVATPVAGRLGDMYGERRMLPVSLGPLVAGPHRRRRLPAGQAGGTGA
ncbi:MULTISPECIES: hypothetical protein [Nocardiopsis]|uniref:hypothetical protein n=1 Tax=Nocardiopsis TaxID=2013 RepID=UPI00197E8411